MNQKKKDEQLKKMNNKKKVDQLEKKDECLEKRRSKGIPKSQK